MTTPHWTITLLACALAGCSTVPTATDSGNGDESQILGDVTFDAAPDATTPNDADTIAPDAAIDEPAEAAADAFAQAPHTPFPVLSAHDHALLHSPRLISIVSSSDSLDARTRLGAWGDAVGASTWWSAVSAAYALGAVRSNTNITGPAINSDINIAQMIAYIDALVAARPAIAPDGNTMYLLYLPDGIASVNGSMVNTNCRNDLGVHTNYHAGGDAWAWVQRCPPPPGTDSITQSMTTAAHEFAESATDVSPTHGYFLGTTTPMSLTPLVDSVWHEGGTEVGDLCAGSQIHVGGLGYQRIWSVGAALAGGDPCVPALPRPYYNVTGPAEWNSFGSARAITVPLTGWSTAPRADWYFAASLYLETTTNDFALAIEGSTDGTGVINNARSLMLTLTAPAGAVSGDWAVVKIVSSEPMTPPPPPYPIPADGTDRFHVWWLGFYLP